MIAEQILLKHIPNGCINLKGYAEEKKRIILAMEEYSNTLRDENEKLKKWCQIAGVPELIINNPGLCSSQPSEKDIEWAISIIKPLSGGI